MSDSAISLGSSAYDVLREEIISGRLAPGERLRASALRERYRLGLTPIREALMRLTSEGLADFTERRGANVRAATVEEFHDLMSTRRDVEVICLTQSIERGGDAWEAEILRAHHMMARVPLPGSHDDRAAGADWESFHRQFHFALVAACGSPWRLQFWNTLADHSERYRRLRLLDVQSEPIDVDAMKTQHRQIMDAVISRDGPRACSLMCDHLRGTEHFVMTRLVHADEFGDK